MSATAWRADPSEAEVVARLLVEFRTGYYGREWPSDNSILASVERLMETTDTEFLLGAPDDDAPPGGVAQLRFRHSVWMAAPDCWLEHRSVGPAARRSGAGRALVDLTLARARERGARRVELDVTEDNEAALELYRGAGFDEFPKSERPVHDVFISIRLD
ncbi:MAG TPA: GNAT family N-acetyltransferase [Solirubrobacteraceae bacterium]|nr:GNAT family N-acetyltransferase [Solirubrobacteraceae bacterium]